MIAWLTNIRGVTGLAISIFWCAVYVVAVYVAGSMAHKPWHWTALRFVTWFGVGAATVNLVVRVSVLVARELRP